MGNDRKRDLKKTWKDQEGTKLIQSMPMPLADLRDLFDFLDRENPPPCDHTLRETILFLRERNLDVEGVVKWLHQNGGYCDCEVIFNVDEKFGEIVGRVPEEE
jgi:hypothetical protein